MRTRTKFNIIIGTCVTVMVLISTTLFVLITNEAFGEITPHGEPYVHEYTYCAVNATGLKGQSYCSMYKKAKEIRQKTYVDGLFFDTESSKFVKTL
jgi:hypothetical protein